MFNVWSFHVLFLFLCFPSYIVIFIIYYIHIYFICLLGFSFFFTFPLILNVQQYFSLHNMKKKLDTRFPAARIKKIMQSDEDVGKIAMAVPLLVSKALELFLQDLCDRTYEITLRRGAKTMNSVHLKQCVQTFNVFDFLKDIVGKVPDLGSQVGSGDDRTICKRRKVDENGDDSDDDAKRNKMPENAHPSGGRGRGSGRGRGRGRGSRITEQEINAHVKSEEDHHADASTHHDMQTHSNDSMEFSTENEVKPSISKTSEACFRNFDLNMDPVDDDGDSPTSQSPAPFCPTEKPTVTCPSEKPATACPTEKPIKELKHEEIPGWSLPAVEKMAIDPIQLVHMNGRIDEEDEDYDVES